MKTPLYKISITQRLFVIPQMITVIGKPIIRQSFQSYDTYVIEL